MWLARHCRRRLLILSVSTLGFFISSFSAVLALDFTGSIVSAIDGDTLEVLHKRHPARIYLSGIDCPEKGHAYDQKAKHAARSPWLSYTEPGSNMCPMGVVVVGLPQQCASSHARPGNQSHTS